MISEKKAKKQSQAVTTPSIMRAPKSDPIKQTVEMLLDVVHLLSDKHLDQLFAKICLEKLRRDAKVMITVYGGK